jgi:hypothetical protein
LLAGLTNNATGTLGLSTNALTGAYGNYNAGMGAANAQLGNLGDFSTNYNNLLAANRAQSAPGIQQQAYGLQNTLFGNGVADSTGAASGSLAAQNFGRGVAQADATNQLNAFQEATTQQNSAASNYGTLTNSANGILSNALTNFGNTNQLISGLNTAQLNNSLQAVQGAGALNTLGLNNYNAALQTGATQATARNQSLFPYASVATALSGTQNAGNILGNALSTAGSSLSGNNSGIGGLLQSLLGKGISSAGNSALSSLFGNGFSLDSSLSGATGAQASLDSAGQFAAANTDAADLATSSNDAWLNSLGGDSTFSSAGGGAAAGAGAAGSGIASSSAAAGLGDASLSTVGTDAATAGVGDVAGAGAASASGEGGVATAGLGSTAGAATAAGIFSVPLILAATMKDSGFTNAQLAGMKSTIQAGKGTTTDQQYKYFAALDQLQAMANNGSDNGTLFGGGSSAATQQAQTLLDSMGINWRNYIPSNASATAYSGLLAGTGLGRGVHNAMKQ